MSIYTDMIGYIEVHGIGKGHITPQKDDPCCILGVKKQVTSNAEWYRSAYNVDDAMELAELCKKYMPTKALDSLKDIYGADLSRLSPDQWVYNYNDMVINTDKDHAIRLLEEAEKLRIKKSV
ncbi:hypothetical protein SEA_WEASELS2_198 [Rhodococcus phage Weasels2]|uniref:Uncharacterized protein n=1 Tax=Rhodococcus phage Weasels2 TaxID=1897437 RepID=A0A1I9SAH0_9CAUD|nr:hypothetical protein FDH04_gp218 [Rhodococcus phage Weasels2]AOZ63776.1 hypothetical protein SEA_WEASELS2_198 [Rhodococcus phage Weasels2]